MSTCCKCSNPLAFDNSTIKELDLNRYLGKWYEIARFDHRFEHGLTDITAEYVLKDNGIIQVLNRGYNQKKKKNILAEGKAKTTKEPGVLRVSFFWNFYSDYRIMALGSNYDWALIGAGKGTDYLWILSRTETLPEETYNQILAEAKRRGFDISKLIKIR